MQEEVELRVRPTVAVRSAAFTPLRLARQPAWELPDAWSLAKPKRPEGRAPIAWVIATVDCTPDRRRPADAVVPRGVPPRLLRSPGRCRPEFGVNPERTWLWRQPNDAPDRIEVGAAFTVHADRLQGMTFRRAQTKDDV